MGVAGPPGLSRLSEAFQGSGSEVGAQKRALRPEAGGLLFCRLHFPERRLCWDRQFEFV